MATLFAAGKKTPLLGTEELVGIKLGAVNEFDPKVAVFTPLDENDTAPELDLKNPVSKS